MIPRREPYMEGPYAAIDALSARILELEASVVDMRNKVVLERERAERAEAALRALVGAASALAGGYEIDLYMDSDIIEAVRKAIQQARTVLPAEGKG